LAEQPVAVHCRVAHSDEVIHRLHDGTAHAGFVLSGPPIDSVRSVRVARSRIVAVCRPDDALAACRRLRVSDIDGHPTVVYYWGPEADPLATLLGHAHRTTAAPVHTIALPMTAVQLAVDEGYIAVVPDFVASRAVERGDVRRLPLSLTWTIETLPTCADVTPKPQRNTTSPPESSVKDALQLDSNAHPGPSKRGVRWPASDESTHRSR
jgi:DNA-binding transcriptional LysR family regulator